MRFQQYLRISGGKREKYLNDGDAGDVGEVEDILVGTGRDAGTVQRVVLGAV